MRYLLATITAFLLLGLQPLPSRAEGGAISPSISVNPSIVRQTLQPGEKKEVTLELTNLGSDPIPLSTSLLNIARISDAGAPEFTNAPTTQSAGTWISTAKPDVILDSGQKQRIIVTLSAPSTAAPGGYSAALIFQAKLPSYYFDIDANARILPALSVSFLVTVSTGTLPSIDNLKINSFQTPRVVLGAPVPLVAEINNPTSFFIYADGDVTVKPMFGKPARVSELKSSVLMPDASRKYVNAYTGRAWPGVYQAKISINDGDKTLVASAKFVVIPWQFILTVVILSLFLAGAIGWRRLRRAWRVLATGQDKKPTHNQPRRPIIR